MKIHVGPDYRIYDTRIGTVVVLLAGGNKSARKKDIKRALELVRGLLPNGK